jgi:hypothetical protein
MATKDTKMEITQRAMIEELNAWSLRSGVSHCSTCDDTGMVASHRRPTIDDPYPEIECDDCSAEDTACKVCGNPVYVSGFDCLACDTVINLSGDQLDAETAEELGKAITAAINVAFRHRAKVRAQVRECVA